MYSIAEDRNSHPLCDCTDVLIKLDRDVGVITRKRKLTVSAYDKTPSVFKFLMNECIVNGSSVPVNRIHKVFCVCLLHTMLQYENVLFFKHFIYRYLV